MSEAALEVLLRKRAPYNLEPFIRLAANIVDPGANFKWNWHIGYLCEYLEAVTLYQIQRLIINIPPRTLKSIIVTIGWPAWLLGRDPKERILAASGAGSLATEHSVYCRTVIQSQMFKSVFPELRLKPDQNEKRIFKTTAGGHRIATSVGAHDLIGKGGRRRILDDPIDMSKLLSSTVLESTNNWLDQTWSTRADDPELDSEVLVMQRLHAADPTAHYLGRGNYEHVCIPQEAPTKTIIIFPRSKRKLVRQAGDFIHPERFGEKAKKKAIAELTTQGYDGQHLQKPAVIGGNRIPLEKFLRYKQIPPKFDQVICSWDTAGKGKDIKNNAKTAGITFGLFENTWYWLDTLNEHLTYPSIKNHVIAKSIGFGGANAVLIEDKSSGQSLIEDLRENSTVPVIPIEPHGDKIMRMDVEVPFIEAGNIALPDPAFLPYPWIPEVESDITQFPNCIRMDLIDSLSQMISYIRGHRSGPVDGW